VFFRQFVDDDLGCGSYLVGDPDAGEAVVIDPAFAIEPYLETAARGRLRIVRVLETHTHADHLSGHGRFALEHGVPVSIHPLGRPEYPCDALADGQRLHAGSVELRVVHTPGHRPEHCAFVVAGELVLSGDSLFVGDAARPDLAIDAREGAADLHRSVRRLAELPDTVTLYPGHVAGSLCGVQMSEEHSSSIGRERATNRALRRELDDFVEESASLSTPKPPTTELLVSLNRGPWVPALPPLPKLDGPGDAALVDTRPVDDFVAGHLPGAVCVALDGGSFATRAAFVVDASRPVATAARTAAEAAEASRLLAAVGLLEQSGFVLGGGPEPTDAVGVDDLRRLLGRGPVQLLDVREPSELEGAALPAATAVPYRALAPALGALDRARPVYTICASGARAALAASLLARAGFDARPVVGGGVAELLEQPLARL
jgi:glyoxylase-like metal-dependent hydrolase (beta-lactamase superfamily II)